MTQRDRAGHSLAELVVAMAVGGAVLALLAGLLAAETRLARRTAEHAARQDAVRVAWHVLAAELRYLVPERDVFGGPADSIGLRAPRGVLLPCAAAGVYRYRGLREPEPAKDSVLAVRSGAAAALRLGAAPPADACPTWTGTALVRLDAAPAGAEPGEPLLLFESGAYHVQARALRYRLGAEGRQPLTGEWFDDAGSTFVPRAGALAAAVRLTPRSTRGAGAAPGERVLLRFWSLNGAHAEPPE